MKNKINSYPLRFYNQNNRPYNYFSNNSDFSHNSNQKIITVERNLNDLKLETETELSKKDGNLSFILDGLQKELDEMDQNIIETDKKLKGATQKNIENSKRLRHKSYNFLKSPAQGKYIQSQINFFSPEKYLMIYQNHILIIIIKEKIMISFIIKIIQHMIITLMMIILILIIKEI